MHNLNRLELIEKWNKSQLRIPKDKSVSNYAVEKEQVFPRNSTVVDLGGGSGTDTLYFSEKGHSVILVDISDAALAIAKKKAEDVNLEIKTFQVVLEEDSLPIENNSVDVIYSRLVIHYFNMDVTCNILNEIHRVLKHGGTAYITVKSLNDASEMEFLKKTAEEIDENVFFDEGGIKSRYTIEQWEKFIKPLGYSEVSVHRYIEDLSGKVDTTKSGNKNFVLTEIVLKK